MRRSTLFEAALVFILIALAAALYAAVSSGPVSEGWTLSGIITAPASQLYSPGDSFGNMFVGDNGSLYAIDGQYIHAIAGNGSRLWSLEVPDRYRMTMYGQTYDQVAAAPGEKWSSKSAIIRDGNLFVLLKPEQSANINSVLLSVSPDGRLLWSIPFTSGRENPYQYRNGYGYPSGIVLHGDVLYVYSDWQGLSLIDVNGTIFCLLEDIRGKPAIGTDGTMYVKNGPYNFDMYGHYSNPYIEAYRPDGTVLWRHDYDGMGINESIMPVGLTDNQPYFRKDTVYIWSNDGIVALNTDGSLRFRHNLSEYYVTGCGFDENDMLYVSYAHGRDFTAYLNGTSIDIIGPDGRVVKTLRSNDTRYFLYGVQDLPGGLLCRVETVLPHGKRAIPPDSYNYIPYIDGLIIDYLKNHSGKWDYPRGLEDLNTYDVKTYDLMTGEELWSHRLPLKKCSVRLEPENAGKLTLDEATIADVNKVPYEEWYASNGIPQGSEGVKSWSWAFLATGNDTVYVNMWSYNYEYPPYYNRSRCVYSGGIYAFDLEGIPVWSVSTDSRVVSVQEQNGTIYYATGGGKVSSSRAGVTAGIFTAAAYVFLRFFFLGVVSRARTRLDQNDNRNRIMHYITANPGASVFDVSKGLAINHGTARYHLLVLLLNHRITSFRADEKYVRFFPKAGTYGPRDKLIIALAWREPLRNILHLLLAKPGLSNMELARQLGVPKSSTMRNVKELTEKGVVVKSLLPDGKIAYSVDNEYYPQALSALERADK